MQIADFYHILPNILICQPKKSVLNVFLAHSGPLKNSNRPRTITSEADCIECFRYQSSNSMRTASVPTTSLGLTKIRFTVLSRSAVTSFSIFIAS